MTTRTTNNNNCDNRDNRHNRDNGFGDAADLNRVAERYTVRVTPAVYEAMHSTAPDDPVARQYLPDLRELDDHEKDMSDPIGDAVHSPVSGIVHRYPDRVLLMPALHCAVYCRYCFRREKVGRDEAVLPDEKLAAALDYIRSDENIKEVILSGGDPLILSPRRLAGIFTALEEIAHVEIIRIHSRVPVADPQRITKQLCAVLEGSAKPVYLAVHVNHAQELTPDAEKSLKKLHAAGCVLLSQSVLLKGVNNDADTLEALFRALVKLRVKPYYLHHPDRAAGTAHFRVTLAEGREIMRILQSRLSGICRPVYMLDIPGGYGKVPVDLCRLHKVRENTYHIEDINGRRHFYADG
ncbi:MAG: lysine-2,3-aminomutase-like protein [Micavibrio sp.]|nr:MAG: lysine-2,3-aminomutase-like protein [Micavibrio sp.]